MLFRKKKTPEVRDVSYDSKSATLKAYTTAKKAEVGILYLGVNADIIVDSWRGMAHPLPWIYFFEKEDEFTIENGWINVHMKPFYGGFLSKKYIGLCYLRCVRLGEESYVHVAPICCLKMHVEPKVKNIAEDGIELMLEGGEMLRGFLYCDKKVEVKICRVNKSMRLYFPELLLSSDTGGQYEFSWKLSAVERGVVVFGKITGKEIVKTFGMSGEPYLLSDVTHASNNIVLDIEWGKLRKNRITLLRCLHRCLLS